LPAADSVHEDIYESLGPGEDTAQQAQILMRAGMAHQQLGSLQSALDSFELALRLARQSGDRSSQALCLRRLATVHRMAGNPEKALAHCQAAKAHYEALDERQHLAAIAREQGLCLRDLRHLKGALERLTESLRICRKLGDDAGIAENLLDVGLVSDQLGRLRAAIVAVEEALSLYESAGSPEQGRALAILEGLRAKERQAQSWTDGEPGDPGPVAD
jgi:tetratricopeptide (TPR) repeat protein